jgi:hypothetical protein
MLSSLTGSNPSSTGFSTATSPTVFPSSSATGLNKSITKIKKVEIRNLNMNKIIKIDFKTF